MTPYNPNINPIQNGKLITLQEYKRQQKAHTTPPQKMTRTEILAAAELKARPLRNAHKMNQQRRKAQHRADLIEQVINFMMQLFIMVSITALLTIVFLQVTKKENLPPCPTEDSTACYWDASERGNGHGHDFIAI
tara:strand:+ start:2180 stop:2584 length:405 start_codon:yes stop_codon:yes gene_type:complete